MSDLIKADSNRAADAATDSATAGFFMPVLPVTKAMVSPRRSSSSGSMQDFVEIVGTTTFAAPPAPAFHYKLSLRNGKLRIWMEDCESKQQWCTSDLDIESYVDINNAVPGANAADYVECFRTLLNKTVEGEDVMPRSFQRSKGKGDAFRLEISMKVQVLTRTRVATYVFQLEQVSVERIDVLESRMRDLQEEVKALRLEAVQNSAVMELHGAVKRIQEDLAARQVEISKLQRVCPGFRDDQ